MFQSGKSLRVMSAIFALSLVAGCADQMATPQTGEAPELAGAWYQIYFDTNGVDINARGQMVVKNVAYVVANSGPTRVTVIGKTDRVGAPPDNLALAKRRADAVRDALVNAGVPSARIDTSWTGEGRQQVATADEVANPRNRVVDVTVVKETP